MSSSKPKSAAEEERQKHRDKQGKYASYEPSTSAADELSGIGEGQECDIDAVVADELSKAMVPGNPENMVMRRCGGGYMLMDRADAPRRIIYTDPLGRAGSSPGPTADAMTTGTTQCQEGATAARR